MKDDHIPVIRIRSVLITGGGGMGRAAALRILDESGKVVLTDCSPTVLKNLEPRI